MFPSSIAEINQISNQHMRQTTGLDLEVEEGRLEVGEIGLENPNSDKDFLGITFEYFSTLLFIIPLFACPTIPKVRRFSNTPVDPVFM